MSYLDEEHEEEREELQELPDTRLDQPAACFICGRPDCKYACFRCGQPVCYNQESYFGDSTCGGWILDTWHPGHPEENEFYCQICLHAGLIPDAGLVIAGIPIKANNGVIEVTIGGQVQELSEEDAKNLIAYLFTERGELFGKPYDPDAEEEHTPELVDAAALPPAENRQCAKCGDFIPEKMGFQYEGRSLCVGCLPFPEVSTPQPVTVASNQTSDQGGQGDDSLGDLEDHPF
jgi:hypothetical protein